MASEALQRVAAPYAIEKDVRDRAAASVLKALKMLFKSARDNLSKGSRIAFQSFGL